MKANNSIVISMRLPAKSAQRLKRMANVHGWTASDVSARLVEEGLRRADFAFIDFRDSTVGRQAYIQGSSLAVWEVLMLARNYKNNLANIAKHLGWTDVKVKAAINYAKAFPDEVNQALLDNDSIDKESLFQLLPQAKEFVASKRSNK